MPSPSVPRLVVVDFGAGNLRSVQRALEAVGEQPEVTSDPQVIEQADALVLPGVGSANDAMKALAARGLVEPLRDYARSGRLFLGVCVGLQVLFDWSDEGGGVPCLGILPGTVERFVPDASARLKVPHMGWNTVRQRTPHPLLEGVPDQSHFYFVHSYYAVPQDEATTIAETQYGRRFPAIVARENVWAVQFHPEKSAAVGISLYRNFATQVHRAVRAHSSR